MTLPPAAALPGWSADAPVEHLPHPGAERALVCPACGAGDQLVAEIPAEAHTPIFGVVRVDDVTEPVADIDLASEVQAPTVHEDLWEREGRIRCLACRWAYKGARPLHRLVEARA